MTSVDPSPQCVALAVYHWMDRAVLVLALFGAAFASGCGDESRVAAERFLARVGELKRVEQVTVNGVRQYRTAVEFPNDLGSRTNVVLLSIDTLRADRLNCYGYQRRRTSPNIDALARDAVLFERCYAQVPGTLASQASILTGYYPTVHGVTYRASDHLLEEVRARQKVVPADYYFALPGFSNDMVTLAETLKVHGFDTVGVHEDGYFSAPLGYSLGFDRFACSQISSDHSETRKRKEGIAKTLSLFERLLDTYRREPFFAFFHSYEVHNPYIHCEFADAERLSAGTGEYFSACYDGGVAYTDAFVGKLIASLRSRGVLDRTVIVLTSDHGEEFGDHYPIWYGGHGESQYDEQIRVPLIIYCGKDVSRPGQRGVRVHSYVATVDIVPTILGLVLGDRYADVPAGSPFLARDGKNLAPLVLGKSMGSHTIYFEDSYHGPERIGVIENGYKFVLQPDPSKRIAWGQWNPEIEQRLLATPARELFDLRSDPQERNNLVARMPELARRLEAQTLAIRRGLEVRHKRSGESSVPVSKDTEKALKSLGYL